MAEEDESTRILNETSTLDMVPLDVALFVLIGYFLYFVLIIVGIPANLFVLIRMIHFKRRNPDTYRSGTGACLLAMSVADLVSLISIAFFCLLSFNLPLPFNKTTYRVVCKITVFCLHSATSIAIWSWLLMSILRWLALYRPLLHHTLYNLPLKAVGVVCVMASLSNIWLLLTVDVDDNGSSCTQAWLFDSELVTRALLLIEMSWSFIVPILVVAYLDLSTLYSIPRLLSARYTHSLLSSDSHNAQNTHMKKSTKTLLRWLAIALVDILLNAPENLLRLATILGFVNQMTMMTHGYIIFKTISDVFYYSQYSFNAAYLALFIYDRATNTKMRKEAHSSLSPLAGGVCTSYEKTHTCRGGSTRLKQSSTRETRSPRLSPSPQSLRSVSPSSS